jgi:RNA polymerase sigma-70 factor, ECF subfamily
LHAKLSYFVPRELNLQEIVSEFYGSVYRFALALSRSEAEAADLTQQTFLLLSRHVNQIRDPSKVKAWLFTTLRREFFRVIRRRTDHPEVEFNPDHHDAPAIDSTVVRSIDAQTILQAFNQIDPNYRAVLELFYLSELSYKEIADVLGIPIGTVMSRLSRGKAQLKVMLTETGSPGRSNNRPRTRDEQEKTGF